MKPDVLGQGIYTISEAAALSGLVAKQVRDWMDSEGGNGRLRMEPVRPHERATAELISFVELIELLVTGKLRDLGISLQAIRTAHAMMRKSLNTSHPFAHQRLLTADRRLFADLQAESSGAGRPKPIEILEQQHVISQVLLPYLERVDYDASSGMARQWCIAEGVVLDPSRAFGKPIIRASGIPTSVLAAAWQANRQDVEIVAQWYGVTPREVEDAVRFEREYFGKAA